MEQKRMTVKAIVDRFMSKIGDGQIVIGPLVWQPSDGKNARVEYFIAAGSDANGFWSEMVTVIDDDDRALILAGLTQGKPIMLHLADDELEMARLCERLWPCEKTRNILEGIEKEREGR